MTSLHKLIQRRGQLKSQLSRFVTFLNECDESKVEQLRVRFERVEKLLEEFDKVQLDIEILDSNNENSDENAVAREEFENQFYDVSTKARRILRPTSTPIAHAETQLFNRTIAEPKIKLPILSLPLFSGKYEDWPHFRDSFEAIIGENLQISDCQKLQYLKAQVTGVAANAIHSIGISNDNYRIALDILRKRFENKRLSVYNHLREIFEIPSLTKESHVLLRSLYDSTVKNIRCLRSLQVPVDSWDTILIYIISNKLDAETRRGWESVKYVEELPNLKELLTFLNERCGLLESLQLTKSNCVIKKPDHKKAVTCTVTDKINCLFCKEEHFIYKCNQFKSLPLEERRETVKKLGMCYNCLRVGHLAFQCKFRGCFQCTRKNNRLLHNHVTRMQGASETPASRASEISADRSDGAEAAHQSGIVTAASAGCLHTKHVLLSTATVIAGVNKKHKCKVLLDCASQANFITENLCNYLGLRKFKNESFISGIGLSSSRIKYRVSVTIQSRHSNYKRTIDCYVLTKITEDLPVFSFDASFLNLPQDIQLADESFNESKEIEMLIGAGEFWQLLRTERRHLGTNMPTLQNSHLGWVLSGPLHISTCKRENRSRISVHCALSQELKKFWLIEECETPKLTGEEQMCENWFKDTTRRSADGRFIVKYPFKENVDLLGESRNQALTRFLSLEKRLSRNKILKTDYENFMREYKELGHMSILDESNTLKFNYYLPHHCVIKEASLSTRCRVVFDGSAATDSGLSLNDVQMTGPTVQNELFAILIRFRKHRIVISADIAKMYRQILIDENQRGCQRILWRDDMRDDILCFVLNTVAFGLRSSPFLATRCLKELSDDCKEINPQASFAIANDMYVDDLLSGAETEDEAIKLREDITKILKTAHFDLRKWASNEPRVIGASDAEQIDVLKFLPLQENNTNKTLGVLWDSRNDTLQYRLKDFNVRGKITKRTILSAISQIFDPIGLISPVVIGAKILLQGLWKDKLSWDDPVESSLGQRWLKYLDDLRSIKDIRIERFVLCKDATNIELHGFSDACEKAYGCCIYLKSKDRHGNCTVNLLCAKSKVAPLQSLSIAKLELCGALLLAKLYKRVCAAMHLKIDNTYLWCDSTIALCWIRAEPGKWKVFVANRVSEIQSMTDIKYWNHVKSAENAADVLSRGLNSEQLLSSNIWWHGPEFLKREIISEFIEFDAGLREIPERRSVVVSLASALNTFNLWDKYSSIEKLTHIVAYCMRFINNVKGEMNKRIGSLTVVETRTALRNVIKLAQSQALSKEIHDLVQDKSVKRKNKLSSLNPFLDDEGLIRVGGRLENADLSYETKHPIILPPGHRVTVLIAESEHRKNFHCGPQALLAKLREGYWPISGRNLVRKIVRQCVTCFKAQPSSITPQMGQLPKDRLRPSPPFYKTGIDYAGPFSVRDKKGRGCKTVKCYVCLFVCLSTKAIHLELVGSLTTESFIASLRRFVSRRGLPCTLFSDNATNFVGARNELEEFDKFLKNDSNMTKIKDFLLEKEIEWCFIPPRAPHFGGLWEAGVKRVKYHLKRVYGLTCLVYEEFNTLLIQIEAVLNSRPLCPLSSNPLDLNSLTPGHFLIGRSITSLVDENLLNVAENRLSNFQKTQAMVQQFWNRWSKEYLLNLQQRSKWKMQNEGEPFTIGSMVLLREDNLPSCKWILGRITRCHPGADGIIRVVSVRTPAGEIKRPVVRLCVLPIA